MNIDATEHVNVIIKSLKTNYGRGLNELIEIFSCHNYEIRLAGETARDIFMNKMPTKMELITSASIHQMRRLFLKRKIPISVDEKVATVAMLYHSYKITTIWPVAEKSSKLKDLRTKRAFWVINSYQRIFTVDSISIDFTGRIYDNFNACEDIINCRVRMMTVDPDALIKNDYFSIFKYFKLFGSITGSGRSHDDKTLTSIMANMSALASIKGEVIWNELKTILLHPTRYECVEPFLECGGGAFLGLPENLNLTEFGQIAKNSNFAKHPLLPMSYLCAFLETRDDVMRVHERLRLSVYERDLAIFLVKHKAATRPIDNLMYYRQMCLLPSGKNKQICREYVLELLKYHNKKSLFEDMLMMPSCTLDPAVLQWQKKQLKRIDIEATDGMHDSSSEHSNNADGMKEPPFIRHKWTAMKSSKKKQRLT
ncbi:CCA tRNA nucleotidyltransferase 1, mitochondrial-like isoform X1 [Bradysia coprophila]|uniref:CCA tRNA nucleotidyltransferase 1, mitochondrial-like isoform X1 n=1 Tax=Bradysia coprophila TaxID=38358 RepID=UPI00187DCBF3|nr:CCA tRNA nucleotidyltransferase 1, mitochondrial-like isoform X1 [Bradysia coprophila]